MIVLGNIQSLSDFQRNTRAHIRRLGKTGKPEVLTVNGKASVVVQDAAAYQSLLDQLEQVRTLAVVESAKRGESIPVREAFASIRKHVQQRRKR